MTRRSKGEDYYQRLLQTLPDCVVVFDLEGRMLEANPQAAELYGYRSVQELLASGKTAFDLIHPDDLERTAGSMQAALEQGIVRNLEYTLLRTDGTGYPAEISVSVIPDPDGHPAGFLAVVRDVSARKKMQSALEESEAKYSVLVNQAKDIVTIVQDGVCKFINPAVSRLGYTVEQVTGRPFRELVAPEASAEIEQRYRARMAGDNPAPIYETKVLKRSGEIVEVEVTVSLIEYQQRPALLAIVRDVTERKREEEERRRLQTRLLHAQKLESLGVLAGGIAHDFNNLLMGVLGNVSLALLELDRGGPVRRYLEQIESAGQHAAALTNQMLAYSGKGKFVIRPLNLSQLVEGMIPLLKTSIGKATLRPDLEKDLPAIEGDAVQIGQVAMNLITNAAESTGDGSGRVAVRTGTVQADPTQLPGTFPGGDLPVGECVFLEVSDNGCGMDAETRARIFDPFFTTKFTGRGLGLAAVLGIVRGHGGAIQVTSTPGRGSTFRVLFPRTDPGTAEAAIRKY